MHQEGIPSSGHGSTSLIALRKKLKCTENCWI